MVGYVGDFIVIILGVGGSFLGVGVVVRRVGVSVCLLYLFIDCGSRVRTRRFRHVEDGNIDRYFNEVT